MTEGARADLDLSEILPAYAKFLGGGHESTAGVNFVRPKNPDEDYVEPSLGWGPSTRHQPPPTTTTDPWRVGNGPATASTGQDLVLARPSFSWDVNGWYARLGVPFPYVHASSGALSRAYLAVDGQASVRTTYCLRWLLDRTVRGLYDASPLGEQFLDDEEVQEALRRRVAAEASRRSERGSYTTAESVMDEWGYLIIPDADPGVDIEAPPRLDEPTQPKRRPFEPIEWTYSYWVWNARNRADTSALQAWQEHLVSCLAARGARVDLAVGLSGKTPHPYTVGLFDGYWVVFLNEAVNPTRGLADRASAALLDQINETHHTPRTRPTPAPEPQTGHPMNATPNSRFGRGGDAAVETDEAASAGRRGGSFRKTHYLPSIGKGKYIVLRYLTDSPDWWYVMSHLAVPTKGAPADWPSERKFPESMSAVCRYDKAFKADPEKGLEAVYTDCYICDAGVVNSWGRKANPVIRVWALAILREEVIGTADMVAQGLITADQVGKGVGYRDATREAEVPKKDASGNVVKDSEGKAVMETVTEPAIIVVNQAVSNYFGGLQSMFGMYKTISDRDYVVKQVNEKKDVEYHHIPLDPIASLKPGTDAWARYDKAIAEQGESVDIEAILMDRSSDDYYATFFDPTKTAPKRGGDTTPAQQGSNGASAPVAQQDSAPSGDVPPEVLEAMRARVRNAALGGSPAEPQQDTAPVAASASTGPTDWSS